MKYLLFFTSQILKDFQLSIDHRIPSQKIPVCHWHCPSFHFKPRALSMICRFSYGEEIPPCPLGSRPLLRSDGQPRKCLPHRNSLCVNALPDNPNADTVCCYHNQVDYFCCLDASAEQCPDYHQVTAVIQNPFPQNPFGLKSYFFREGIEDEIMEGMVENNQVEIEKSGPDNGFIVRHG